MFLDNASTTKPLDESLKIFNEVNTKYFYNPSALYKSAVELSKGINHARENILNFLGGSSGDKFIFTSGATEANNMVINSVKRFKKGKFLFSIGEHPSIYNCAINLQNEGFNVEFVGLTRNGTIDIDDYYKKLTDDVVFISIMHVSNETGAINPIKECVEIAKRKNKNIIFHCDGVQAFGKIEVNVKSLGVDFYTISGHKIYAPKGIGGLFVKKDVYLKPFINGGGQEFNFRSGTENVGGIFAFEKACEFVSKNLSINLNKIETLRQKLFNLLENEASCVLISDKKCSPYIISLSFPGTRAETILHMLDDKGYIVGSGSACSSKKRDNRILRNCGYGDSIIEGSLRISLSKDNVNDNIDAFINELKNVVKTYKGKM